MEAAPAPTRGEFDMLAGHVSRIESRLETMDAQGTRGVQVLQAQVMDMIKDLAQIQAQVETWQASHLRLHEKEIDQRRVSRRWGWTFAAGAAAGMGGLYAMVGDLLSHVH